MTTVRPPETRRDNTVDVLHGLLARLGGLGVHEILTLGFGVKYDL